MEGQEPPHVLGYQLPLFGPRAADYAHHITTCPPPSFGTMRHLCLLYVILIWRNFLLCSVSNRQITHKCKLWNFTTEHDWNLPDSRCDRSTSRKIDSESSFPYKLASSHIQWHLNFWLIVLVTKGKCSQRVNFFGCKKLVFQTVLAQIIKKTLLLLNIFKINIHLRFFVGNVSPD